MEEDGGWEQGWGVRIRTTVESNVLSKFSQSLEQQVTLWSCLDLSLLAFNCSIQFTL